MAPEDRAESAQRLVPLGVAVLVVDELEMIDVGDEHGKTPPLTDA